MKLKDWNKSNKIRKADIADGVYTARDIDGSSLGEVEYNGGKLIRRTKYSKNKKKIKIKFHIAAFLYVLESAPDKKLSYLKRKYL